MVHKNIHDYNVSESLKHENGLTVLGFKFEISDDPTLRNTAMDTLTELTKKYLNNKDDKIDKYMTTVMKNETISRMILKGGCCHLEAGQSIQR